MQGHFEDGVMTIGTLFYYDNIQLSYDGVVSQVKGSYIRNGFGKLIYKNGDEYEGNFFNDMFHGKGVFKF